MLEEALRVFKLNNICDLKDLDNIYKMLIRKNYEDNFPMNKEIGMKNVRLYEWSYQIILPFAIGKTLELKNSSYLDLATLKILVLLQKLGLSKSDAYEAYKFDTLLGFNDTFFNWCVNELIKKDLIPLSEVNNDLLEAFYNLGSKKEPELCLRK